MISVQHLMDSLTDAQIEAPAKNYVEVQPVGIARQTRMSIFQHPNSRIKFASLELGSNSKLKFGIGVKEVAWTKIKSAVEFKIVLKDQKGKSHEIFVRELDPRNEQDRRFIDFELSLKNFDKQKIELEFITSVKEGQSNGHAWSAWTDPSLESEKKPPTFRKNKETEEHIIFIVADALRRDHLAAYGNPWVKTPNLDLLAKEGILVANARTQSSTSLGAYASILTGLHANKHKINAEWGQIETALANIPTFLKQAGYHCVIASGEREHEGQVEGISAWFDERLDCLGVPAQSGDITSRRFIDWLDKREEGPFFFYLQYFDTHPPCVLPESYWQQYYKGDPCNKLSSYASDRIKEIRGVESILEFELFLQGLEYNIVNSQLEDRLRDSAAALLGKASASPDLAILVKELGPASRKNMSEIEFGNWLLLQADKLRAGQVDPELIKWINEVLPFLRQVEEEIVSYLNGVKDFRFALAQYCASVSFLDTQIGALIQALKDRSLYDNSTIIFCAAHGEILSEHGMTFHHLALTEEVAQVPLIIKPSLKAGKLQWPIYEGMMDLIDIFPTLAESIGKNLNIQIDGISHWKAMINGASCPRQESFGISQHQSFALLLRPPYLFIKALKDLYLSPEFKWKKGESGLYILQTPMTYENDLSAKEAELSRLMNERLDKLLSMQMSPA